jgi:hypothetical protein
MLCDKGIHPYLGVSGITEQNHDSMQQLHIYCLWIQRSDEMTKGFHINSSSSIS